MKSLFSEYGGAIITVIAVVALIAIISTLMASGNTPGLVYNQFSNLITKFFENATSYVGTIPKAPANP